MSCRSIMELCICNFRGDQGRKITGDVDLTADRVETISNLFLHIYKNIERNGIKLHNPPAETMPTQPLEKKNNKRNKTHARHLKTEKREQSENL